jgi:hypothetical protein
LKGLTGRRDGELMSYDLEGSLRCFTLSDVLQLLSFSGQTGTLTLKQGWNLRTICFESGRLTYIAAATRLPTIGELLIHAGRLTPDQLRIAVTSAEHASLGLAPTLLEWGWVTADDLKRCQDQLLEETIYSLFLWRNCRFTFESEFLDKTRGLAVDLTTERLVIDGTRRVDEWIHISPYVPSMRMTFVVLGDEQEGAGAAPASVEDGEEIAKAPLAERDEDESDELSDQDRRVLEAIDDRRDGVSIALTCGLTQFETAKSLAQLSRLGFAKAQPPRKDEICELFAYVVESIYLKLGMFGHSRVALEFLEELNRFALQNGLQVHMLAGKVTRSDTETKIDPMELIDLYKLFIAIQQNRFSRMFEPSVVQGLVEGLYLHVDPEHKELLQIYEFYQIEGLLALSAVDRAVA